MNAGLIVKRMLHFQNFLLYYQYKIFHFFISQSLQKKEIGITQTPGRR